MPRQARIDAPGVLHHVLQRGVARGRIFLDSEDCRAFVDRFGQILKETGTSCCAWALMPNHLHLLLRTGRVRIGKVMQRVFGWYAGHHNWRHRRNGRLFQNRFKSIVCEEEPYFLELVRYIHLNPLRAGLARGLGGLRKYEWSGHAALLGTREREWQEVDEVLAVFSSTGSRARSAYERFVAEGVGQGHRREFEGGGRVQSAAGVAEYVADRGKGKAGAGDERILGGADFVARVLRQVDKEETRRSRLRRNHSIEDVLRLVGRALGFDGEAIRGNGKGRRQAEARALACYLLVRELGFPGAEVAAALGVTQAAVSIGAERGKAVSARVKLNLD